MKKILLLVLLSISTVLFAQNGDISFAATTHDFGKIKQHVPVTYVFTFVNKGSKPALIEVATAECGCTTPEYTKAAVMKGKSSEIKVTYNAENMGTFKKNVTVKFANLEPVILTISGEVQAK